MAIHELAAVDAGQRIRKAVDEQLAKATDAGHALARRGDLAVSARYDARAKRLRIELASGIGLSIPVEKIQGLGGASSAVIGSVQLEGGGYGLHWPALDLDVAVPDLVAGCFGSRAWMSALGRQGGAATSESKRTAARENGRKGGRPKKAAGAFCDSARHADIEHARSILQKGGSALPVRGDEPRVAPGKSATATAVRIPDRPIAKDQSKSRRKQRRSKP